MLEIATRARRPRWRSRSRRAATFSLTAALSGALGTGVARADEVDVCISAAERSQVQRRDGHLGAAREALLSCARDACPGAIQKDCKRWLGEVEAATPSVVIRAIDASGNDVVAVRVVVDGVRLTYTLDGRALAVDPGEHHFRFEAGKRVVEQVIVIREGERGRMLSLKLPPVAPSDASRRIPVGAWALGGLGAVALGTGVVFWIEGRSERAHLYATCGVKHDCASSEVDRARTKLVVGDVVSGVGLVAVGAAVWWALAAPSSPRPSVEVRPVSGGVVMSWRGTF